MYVKFHIACSANLRVCLNEFGLPTASEFPAEWPPHISLWRSTAANMNTTNRSKYFAANVSHIKSIAQEAHRKLIRMMMIKIKSEFREIFHFFSLSLFGPVDVRNGRPYSPRPPHTNTLSISVTFARDLCDNVNDDGGLDWRRCAKKKYNSPNESESRVCCCSLTLKTISGFSQA